MKLVKIGLFLLSSVVLVACGGGGNSGTSDEGTVVQAQTPASFVRFADSRVQVFYPNNWVLETSSDIAAQFLAPERNALGGFDNCTLDYEFLPNSSLVEVTDGLLEIAVADNPEPSVSFLTVNGVPASRINGFAQLLQFTVPIKIQTMYRDSTGFVLICTAGDGNAQLTQSIMDSMELL